MKKIAQALTMAALGAILSTSAFAGSSEHGAMKGMEHGSMKGMEMKSGQKMEHEGHMGEKVYESTVEGYRFAYHTMDMKEHMEAMKDMPGMSMMKGTDMSQMKSHHLMLYIQGPDGKLVEEAKVGYKVEGPAGEQKTMAMGMKGGFGADVDFKAKGTYEIKTKAVVGDKSLVDEFKYEVK